MPVVDSARSWFRHAGRRWLVSLVLVLVCLGMARLQLWRAETRGAIFEQQQAKAQATPVVLDSSQRDASALEWRPVTARGVWLPERTLFLDNKIYQQRVGYHVLTPLQLEGTKTVVLVNRGWVTAPRLRSELPPVSTAPGLIDVSGIARHFATRTFELSKNPPVGAIWQHVRESEFREHSGLDTLPVILLQKNATTDNLVRDWNDVGGPDNPANRHFGYAAMWLIFALMAAGYGVIAWRRND